MKKFENLPSPDGEDVRRTEGVISDDQRSRGQEGKPFNKTSPRPVRLTSVREREEFVSERSELTNSGEGLKVCKLFNDSSLNDILLKSQNDTVLSTYRPIALLPLNNKKLDCFAYARNDVKNSIVKALSPYSPIPLSPLNNKKLDCFAHARNDVKNPIAKALSPNSPIAISPSNKKTAFTKPSRATSGSESRQIINENHAFRFDLERWRLMRGAVDSRKRVAFTLAEVMIVVAIIGVVAMFVLPLLLTEVTERVDSNRQANIAQKITKAVELMIVGGDYEQFETTEQFADKLQKYLKITKRCNSDELTKCWPTKKVTVLDGTKYDVSKAITGKQLHTGNETNNVGFVLNDGASIILSYNPNASIPNADSGFKPTKKSLPVGGGKTKEFAYTSNATNAIDFVMDVNGGQGPNAETDKDGKFHDIRSFKSASFSPFTSAVCEEKYPGSFALPPESGIEYCLKDLGTDYECIVEQPFSSNYWAGAKKKCSSLGMQLPDKDTLVALYWQRGNYSEIPASWYWSSNERNDANDGAYAVNLSTGKTVNNVKSMHTYNALCIGN